MKATVDNPREQFHEIYLPAQIVSSLMTQLQPCYNNDFEIKE
jgi:hypothetical protein